MTMKTKSIRYSTKRYSVKKKIKNELLKQIANFEQQENPHTSHYEYLKARLDEIEQKEIEGYIRRVKLLAPYENELLL